MAVLGRHSSIEREGAGRAKSPKSGPKGARKNPNYEGMLYGQ